MAAVVQLVTLVAQTLALYLVDAAAPTEVHATRAFHVAMLVVCQRERSVVPVQVIVMRAKSVAPAAAAAVHRLPRSVVAMEDIAQLETFA